MSKIASVLMALFGAFLLPGSVVVALQSTNSEPDLAIVDVLFGLPVLLVVGGISFMTTRRCFRRGALTRKRAALYYAGIAFLSCLAFQVVSRCLTPSNISYEFSYPGNTGTYHMVQFYFKNKGVWLEGPSVEGWPLTVSFPDLNGDGYPDIRVTENAGTGSVEFVFLPKNDGHSFWRAIKNNSRLSAGYPPADYFSNYP